MYISVREIVIYKPVQTGTLFFFLSAWNLFFPCSLLIKICCFYVSTVSIQFYHTGCYFLHTPLLNCKWSHDTLDTYIQCGQNNTHHISVMVMQLCSMIKKQPMTISFVIWIWLHVCKVFFISSSYCNLHHKSQIFDVTFLLQNFSFH